MKSHTIFILTSLLYLLFSSCNRDNDVACTMEYRYVTITVNGGLLDDFFTIRNTNGDTIRINKEVLLGDSEYVVLNES